MHTFNLTTQEAEASLVCTGGSRFPGNVLKTKTRQAFRNISTFVSKALCITLRQWLPRGDDQEAETWVLCLHVCLYLTSVPGTSRGQKRVSGPQGLELQMAACRWWELNLGPLQDQCCHLSGPVGLFCVLFASWGLDQESPSGRLEFSCQAWWQNPSPR